MPTLSIVIPVFNEERKIARDILQATEFLSSSAIDGEILISDDGSSDSTVQAAREIQPTTPCRVLAGSPHRGKGSAVRNGMLASQGKYVMFADSGMTVPYHNALRGLRLLQSGACELAHGSRELPESIIRRPRDRDRKILSFLFHATITRFLGIPSTLTDTQCGFKLYRGDVARELYAACGTDGFMFDIEIILHALNRGLQIREFPVEWSCDRDSRLRFSRNAGEIIRDLIRLRHGAIRRLPPIQP